MRQAAAAARQQLLKLASVETRCAPGKTRRHRWRRQHLRRSGEVISYAELLGGQRFDIHSRHAATGTAMIVAPDVKAKDHKDYKIVGTPVPRVDLPPKFTGEFVYTPDVRVPGMLHGRVVRPPVVNSRPRAWTNPPSRIFRAS